MKNIEISKRVLAFISATTITLTMSGCSQSGKTSDNSSITTSLIFEFDNSNSTTSHINSSEENSNIQNSENNKQEDKTSTSSAITPGPTPRPSNNSKPSSSSTPGNSSASSSKPNSSSTPTSKPSSSAPSSSTVKKITSSNINDIDAINLFVGSNDNVYKIESTALLTSIVYTYNGQNYKVGSEELAFIIAILNEDKMTNTTLKELLGHMSLDDLERCSRIFGVLATTFAKKNMNLHFENFVLETNTRAFLNELETQIKQYKQIGNVEEFGNYVEDFYKDNNQYVKHGDSMVLDFVFYSFISSVQDNYENIKLNYYSNTNAIDSSDYFGYVKNKFYDKFKSKQLTK